MEALPTAGVFFDFAIHYFIASVLVGIGIPPFYRGFWMFTSDRSAYGSTIRVVIPYVLGLMVMMVLAVVVDPLLLFVVGGLIAVAASVHVRRDIRRSCGVPLPWATHPITVRWPMVLFDTWTVGVSLVFMAMANNSF
ncbi:MAG: hypothetical protein ABJ215_10820 [Alphaproteobacteria bacterium]